MALTSNAFIFFLLVCLVIYYLMPGRFQWCVLLAASAFFYFCADAAAGIFLVYSIVVTYITARMMQKNFDLASSAIEKQKEKRTEARKHAKRILILGILLDLAVLVILKYANFFAGTFCSMAGISFVPWNLLVPLGISYYTFQTIGYLLDVYWERSSAEKNIFRLALFVSFFPQLMQGPIGRYRRLSETLYVPHVFSWHVMGRGLERIIWGLFKKMIIADWAAVYAGAIFGNPDKYAGIAGIGAVLYAIQLYGDFSGGIDMVIGVAELFGVRLDENFRQPYFSVSMSDFWQRWHMTLGSWMKDYIFYPIAISGAMTALRKKAKKFVGKKNSRVLPACVANIVVFFLVGLWHGAAWNFILWGLYNGVLIVLSTLCSGLFERIKKILHVPDKTAGYRVFVSVRTFFLVTLGWFFYGTDQIKTVWKMIGYAFTRFSPSQILTVSAGKLGIAYTPYALMTLGAGCFLLFLVSMIKERGISVRDALAEKPLAVRFLLFSILLICIPLFAPMAAARGFIYAQF